MSQIFNEKGEVIPVTLVNAGPCLITQVKKKDSKDKYSAVQIGFDKKKSLSKAVKGHLKDLENFRWLKEFRLNPKTEQEGSTQSDGANKLKRGDKITVETFEIKDKIKITGVSKGKGFQGVVRRHGFHGSPASHGHKDQLRLGGSIGATDPARVFKGKKMPGHMGSEQITVKNLEIIKIDKEKNILYVKGAVPGARNSLVLIQGEGELKITDKNTDEKQINSDKKIEKAENKETEKKVEENK